MPALCQLAVDYASIALNLRAIGQRERAHVKADNPTAEVARIERKLKATRTKIARLQEHERRWVAAIAALRGQSVASAPAPALVSVKAAPRKRKAHRAPQRRRIAKVAAPSPAPSERRIFVTPTPEGNVPRYRPDETMVGYAERVLRATDGPLPMLLIIERMMAGGYPQSDRKKLRDSLQRTIDRKIERGSGPFRKAPGKSMYAVNGTDAQHSLIADAVSDSSNTY
jgi:hypothetical protein